MSAEEDIFLKTFSQMIKLLEELNSNIEAIKKSLEMTLPSIDEMGKGLTDVRTDLQSLSTNLNQMLSSEEATSFSPDQLHQDLQTVIQRLDDINNNFISSATAAPSASPQQPQKVEQQPAKQSVSQPVKSAEPSSKKEDIRPHWPEPTEPEHPVFITLINKINAISNYKEIGETLIDSLEQIESKFSFSRVFYEIRRIANSYIRKGEKEIPAEEKVELSDKIRDWEERLVEGGTIE
jgi:DNA repair exonuclease SbcCD ATPase subunit